MGKGTITCDVSESRGNGYAAGGVCDIITLLVTTAAVQDVSSAVLCAIN